MDMREHLGLQTQSPACMMSLREKAARPPPRTWHSLRSSQSGCGPGTLLGGPPTGSVAEPPPSDPSRQCIPGSPAPPPAPGLPAPFPRWPSQCLILLQIPAEPTRPPPLPPSRPQQPRPHWARACSCCAPHPLLAQLARPRCSREEAAAGVPQAPPALGPSREAGRPAPPDPPWVSASGGRRAAGGASAGGGAGCGGDACHRSRPSRRTRQHLGCCAWPGACPRLLPPLGPGWGRPGAAVARHCGRAGRALDAVSLPSSATVWGSGRLTHPRLQRPCPAGPGGCC